MFPMMRQTVRAALKNRNPSLERRLERCGVLDEFVEERAQLVSSRINARLQAVRQAQHWDADPLSLVANLNTARAGIAERVMADLLEFQDEGREFLILAELDLEHN